MLAGESNDRWLFPVVSKGDLVGDVPSNDLFKSGLRFLLTLGGVLPFAPVDDEMELELFRLAGVRLGVLKSGRLVYKGPAGDCNEDEVDEESCSSRLSYVNTVLFSIGVRESFSRVGEAVTDIPGIVFGGRGGATGGTEEVTIFALIETFLGYVDQFTFGGNANTLEL